MSGQSISTLADVYKYNMIYFQIVPQEKNAIFFFQKKEKNAINNFWIETMETLNPLREIFCDKKYYFIRSYFVR